jgi:hypothetical protein
MGILEGHEEAGERGLHASYGGMRRLVGGLHASHGGMGSLIGKLWASWRGMGKLMERASRVSWRPEEAGGGALGGARVGAEWGLGQ